MNARTEAKIRLKVAAWWSSAKRAALKSLSVLFGAVDLRVYSLLALLVLGPLLLPGYILTLDMVFTPELRPPDAVSSSYLFRMLLHIFDLVLPADLIQKVLLFSTLLMAGLGMHRLMAQLIKPAKNYFSAASPKTAKETYDDGLTDLHVRPPVHHTVLYFAGLLYMVNPFTYGRFVTGQYAVLLGYALLPWLLRSLFKFIARPNYRSAFAVAGWAIAISIVSIHTILIATIPAALIIGLQLWRLHRGSVLKRRLLAHTSLVAAVWLIASSYWLLPVLAGQGPQAATISSFTAADRQAFATTGVDTVNRVGNVIGMQGFWAEGRLLFDMPQSAVSETVWTVSILALLGLVAIGLAACWRHGRRGVAIVFGLCILLGVVFGSGLGGGWLAEHVPLYAGYREPHKFTGLVVLGYSVLAMFGAASIGQRLDKARPKQWKPGNHARETAVFLIASAALLAIPVLTATNMFWGAAGQLRSVQYPAGWYEVNRLLNQAAADRSPNSDMPPDSTDPLGQGQVTALVLPWHLYLHMDFVGRVTANPAINFFDQPVVSSNDPEILGAARSVSGRQYAADQQQVEAILFGDATADPAGLDVRRPEQAGARLAAQLAAIDINYIILTKNSDYRRYDYLMLQPGLERVYDDEDISLFHIRNPTE